MKNAKLMRSLSGAWLTKTGLLGYCEAEDVYFFCSNGGEFRRYASKEEAHAIESILPEVRFEHNPVCTYLPEKWRFLWSWRVSDYTEWKAETCCNGGDYAFHQTHNLFGRMNAGNLELLDVVRHTTSAEFSYDEANGIFQNSQMGEARFIDCEDSNFTLYTQLGHSQEFSLNQFGQTITWQEALTSADCEFHQTHNLFGRMNAGNLIWQDERKESPSPRNTRLQILKDTFNWDPPKRR